MTPDRPDIAILKDRFFTRKACLKTQILSKKLLITDVVTGKYIEEAQPLKLQPMQVKNQFYPQKATTCIAAWEKNNNTFGCIRFRLQGRKVHYKKVSCLSCTKYAYWSLSMNLPNIIKIFQTIKKL